MMAVGGQNQKHARKRAVEMPGCGKRGKPKAGFPLSHRHESLFSGTKNRAAGGLRPPPGGGRFATP